MLKGIWLTWRGDGCIEGNKPTLLLSCPSRNCSHLRAHALAALSAIHRLGVIEIALSPHHCVRTAHPCARSVKGSPTEPVLSRSSRQRLGHLQSHVDGGWHVCQAVFPEPQSVAACRRVERHDCAHEALSQLQSASSWLVMEQLVSGVCRLSCAFHAAGNSPPYVRRSDTGQ